MGSLPFLALALLLAFSSQATAFTNTASHEVSHATDASDLSTESSVKIERFDVYDEDDQVEEWEEEDYEEEEDDEIEEWDEEDEDEWDEEDEEEEEDYEDNEEEYEEEKEDDYDEEEEEDDDWTEYEYQQMDLLYERYLQQIEKKYGANWEAEYELDVDKEELYERYLEFQHQKKAKIEATHRALKEHQATTAAPEDYPVYNEASNNHNNNRTDEIASLSETAFSLPQRSHPVILNTGLHYQKPKEGNPAACSVGSDGSTTCSAPTTIITIQHGRTQSVIGSI